MAGQAEDADDAVADHGHQLRTGAGALGETAHIVAHSSGENAPREDPSFTEDRQDTHNNLKLACANCHNEIDKQIVAETMTVDLLRELKKAHEDEILHLTGLVSDRRTVMLRVRYLRDSAMVVDADAATTAVTGSPVWTTAAVVAGSI